MGPGGEGPSRSPPPPGFSSHASRSYSIKLTVNLRAQIDSGDPGISFGHLTILLASIVIEIIATFCENSPILRKVDLFINPCDLKVDLIKNRSTGFFIRTVNFKVALEGL